MANNDDIRKHLKLVESMLTEGGDIGYNWFTNDKRILIRAYEHQGLSKKEALHEVNEMEAELGDATWDMWHPIEDYRPPIRQAQFLSDIIGSGPEAQEIDGVPTEYDYTLDPTADEPAPIRDSVNKQNITVVVGMGHPTRYFDTELKGAYVEDPLAVWYGDSSTWL